jgi:LacI family transcriptional regulator
MESLTPVGRNITLNDIAAGCGVSRATVSLVLRGSPLVNKHTRARVEDELRRQGYVYNRAAANLRRRTSSSIALVINELANPFFAEFAAGVDEALGEAGFVTLLGSTGESSSREHAVLSSLIEHGPGGIILSPAEGSEAREVLAAVGARTPMVLFNRELGGTLPEYAHWDRLMLDNQRGTRLATEHLIARGHRRIAFFGGHDDSSSCRERHAGYVQAMHAAGLDIAPHWRVESALTRVDAARATLALLAGDATLTAAVCYNDAVALGLMLGLNQHGRQPGRDFAVTGFDDIAEASLSMPPLTTLSTAPRARGRQAAELILARLQHPQAKAGTVVAPVDLVVRESSCPPL